MFNTCKFFLFYREIGRMDPRDLSRDTSGTRAYADFLVELAGRVPSQIIPNISVLLCHLDGEVNLIISK